MFWSRLKNRSTISTLYSSVFVRTLLSRTDCHHPCRSPYELSFLLSVHPRMFLLHQWTWNPSGSSQHLRTSAVALHDDSDHFCPLFYATHTSQFCGHPCTHWPQLASWGIHCDRRRIWELCGLRHHTRLLLRLLHFFLMWLRYFTSNTSFTANTLEASTTFLFCDRVPLQDSSTEDLNLDVCSPSNSTLTPSMHALSKFGETLPYLSNCICDDDPTLYNLNCWHSSHAEAITRTIQCSLELMIWCPSPCQWIASDALWQSSFASSITHRWCRTRRSVLVLLEDTSEVWSRPGLQRFTRWNSNSCTPLTPKSGLTLFLCIHLIDPSGWADSHSAQSSWHGRSHWLILLHGILINNFAGSWGSLLYDLVFRDTHLVKLVVGRALLTDGIVHSTLLVDEVRSWQTRRHSLIDRLCSSVVLVVVSILDFVSVLGLITLLNNFCITYRWAAADWLISWSGHPRPSHYWAPVYRGCSCRDPPVWWLIQAGMMSHQSANPFLLFLHWGSAALHWAEAVLHWLLTWRVHLQHYQSWPMLCTHRTTHVNYTKLRRDLTWLAWLENSIDLDIFQKNFFQKTIFFFSENNLFFSENNLFFQKTILFFQKTTFFFFRKPFFFFRKNNSLFFSENNSFFFQKTTLFFSEKQLFFFSENNSFFFSENNSFFFSENNSFFFSQKTILFFQKTIFFSENNSFFF